MERNISDVIVVGSGASGVHAAAVIVEAGCAVTMLDGGYRDETYAKLIPEKILSRSPPSGLAAAPLLSGRSV